MASLLKTLKNSAFLWSYLYDDVINKLRQKNHGPF